MAHGVRHSPGLDEVWHMVSRHTLGAAQVHGHGLVTPPVLGAVQVRVHGLADRVRDGVLLCVSRGLRPCEHAVQVPAPYR